MSNVKRRPAEKTWLITGSVAAHHWFPDRWNRPSLDIDIFTPSKISGSSDCRIETQWHEVSQEIIDRNIDPVFVDADMLLTIKFSHAEWPVKWQKTMGDIWRFQQEGCTIHWDMVPKLKAVWKQIHGKKRVNLNQPVEEFFSHDVVARIYNHEEVHEAVKFNVVPMHERIRPDLSNVWCSEEMFMALDHSDQMACAMEEIMVTGIERMKLTSESTRFQIYEALTYAHRQLITSMTTGWFNTFLIINAPTLLNNAGRKMMSEQIIHAISILEKS